MNSNPISFESIGYTLFLINIINRFLALYKLKKGQHIKIRQRGEEEGSVCFLSPCVISVNLQDLLLAPSAASCHQDNQGNSHVSLHVSLGQYTVILLRVLTYRAQLMHIVFPTEEQFAGHKHNEYVLFEGQ